MKAHYLTLWKTENEEGGAAKIKGSLSWFSARRQYGTLAMNKIAQHPRGSDIYTAYGLMREMTSTLLRPYRGWLVRTIGQKILPLSAQDMADETGFPVGMFEVALEVLSSERIGWIQLLDFETPERVEEEGLFPQSADLAEREASADPRKSPEKSGDLRKFPEKSGDLRKSPDASGNLPGKQPVEPDRTGHDPTGHDPTQPNRTEPVAALACARAGTGAGATAPRGTGNRRGADRPGADACSIPASSRPLIEQIVRDRSPPEERRLVRSMASIERLAHMEGILALTSRAEAWALQFHCYADVVCDLYSLPDYANQENSFAAVIRETASRDDRARIGAECINKLLETRRWLAAGNTGDFWAIWQAHMKRVLWPETVESRRC